MTTTAPVATLNDLVCDAARQLSAASHDGVFSFGELLLSLWQNHTDRFCLQGYPEYPDSNRLITCLCHRNGPIKDGKIERKGVGFYRWVNHG